MPYGASIDVAGRLSRAGITGDFSVSTKPTKLVVEDWINQVSLRLDGRIRAAGYTPSSASVDGLQILELLVVGYAAGMVERLYAGATEGEPNDSGRDLQAPFLDFLDRLTKEPGKVALEVGLTAAATSNAGTALSSFHTDSSDKDDTSVVPDRTFKVTTKF